MMPRGKIKTLHSLREALSREDLFASQIGGPSWAPWRSLLLAICGEELNAAELVDFKALTGRDTAPAEPVREFYGADRPPRRQRRSMAVLAGYLASCKDYRAILAPRERAQIQIIAASVDQATLLLDFVEGAFAASETRRPLVLSRNASTIELASRSPRALEVRKRRMSYHLSYGDFHLHMAVGGIVVIILLRHLLKK